MLTFSQKSLSFGAIGAALVLAGPLSAAITYVDASSTNTVAAAGGSWLTASPNNGINDLLWTERNGSTGPGPQAFGGNTYQAESAENTPVLITTVTGLTVGSTYNVYVYYLAKSNGGVNLPGAAGSQLWVINAGLDGTNFTTFDYTNGTPVNLSNAEYTPSTTSYTTEHRFRALVGTATVGASGELELYVDNGTVSGDRRTLYDGMGYELIPEPSSALLFGASAGMAMFFRRRQ